MEAQRRFSWHALEAASKRSRHTPCAVRLSRTCRTSCYGTRSVPTTLSIEMPSRKAQSLLISGREPNGLQAGGLDVALQASHVHFVTTGFGEIAPANREALVVVRRKSCEAVFLHAEPVLKSKRRGGPLWNQLHIANLRDILVQIDLKTADHCRRAAAGVEVIRRVSPSFDQTICVYRLPPCSI